MRGKMRHRHQRPRWRTPARSSTLRFLGFPSPSSPGREDATIVHGAGVLLPATFALTEGLALPVVPRRGEGE